LRRLGRIQEAEVLEERVRKQEAAKQASRERMLSGKAAEELWTTKYQSQLAYKEELVPFRDELKAISDACETETKKFVGDHQLWCFSDRLIDAFDIYDPDRMDSGCLFSQEYMHCTSGMFGAKANVPKLAEWFDIGYWLRQPFVKSTRRPPVLGRFRKRYCQLACSRWMGAAASASSPARNSTAILFVLGQDDNAARWRRVKAGGRGSRREMEWTIAADKKVLRGCQVPDGVLLKDG